jgi:hypothetical protein
MATGTIYAQETANQEIQAGSASITVGNIVENDPMSTKPSEEDLRVIAELAEKSLNGRITSEEQAALDASGTTIELLPVAESKVAEEDETSSDSEMTTVPEEGFNFTILVIAMVMLNVVILALFGLFILLHSRKEEPVV